jgi:drug/metabolite transporter (DMT)-like permease
MLGFAVAAAGFFYIVLRGVGTPDPAAALLMVAAGVSWGAYSLLGQGAEDPDRMTARNFVLTVPLAGALALAHGLHLSGRGWILAGLSGAVTSGMGYILWYRVLGRIKTSTAAVIQLSVPALAALGGVAILDEALTARLAWASVLIIGGIALKVAPGRPA